MSGQRRHRDSPRMRRLAREAGVDLATVPPSGRHGRATPEDLAWAQDKRTAPAAPAASVLTPTAPVVTPAVLAGPAPAAALPSSSLLEIDVTAFLRRAAFDPAAVPPRTHLLAAAAGSLARAVSDRRLARLPAGPVDVDVDDDDGRAVAVTGADLLSVAGLCRMLASAGSAPPLTDGPPASVEVVGTGVFGTTVDVLPVRSGRAVALSVGPVVRRPVVVLGEDGQEQIGIRSMVWLALSVAGSIEPPDASALLARVGQDLRLTTGAGR